MEEVPPFQKGGRAIAKCSAGGGGTSFRPREKDGACVHSNVHQDSRPTQ